MDTKTLAAILISAAVGAGVATIADRDAAPAPVLTEAQATLQAACPEVADAPGECSYGCKTHLGDAAEETEGWCCGGAYMPQAIQTCLSKAVGR